MSWDTPSVVEQQSGKCLFPPPFDKVVAESGVGQPQQSCPYCPYKSRWSHNLRRHIQTHTDISKLDCPECEAVYYSIGGLQRHIFAKHNTDLIFKEACCRCVCCGIPFSNTLQLVKHYHTVHHLDQGYMYQCGKCTHTFRHPEWLLAHLATHTQDTQK